MFNFGFSKLRMVRPKSDFTNDEKALACCCAGRAILKSATVYSNIESCVADFDYLYATSARIRGLNRKFVDSREIDLITQNTGILFGPENAGLSNDDLRLADTIISINAINNPLNLVQATGILLYEFAYAILKDDVKHDKQNMRSRKKELDYFYSTLERNLNCTDFFQEKEKKPKMMQNIIAMFSRMELSHQEVQTLIGMFKSMQKTINEEMK